MRGRPKSKIHVPFNTPVNDKMGYTLICTYSYIAFACLLESGKRAGENPKYNKIICLQLPSNSKGQQAY